MRSVFKSQNRVVFDFDVDFNILTAFIRLGRAGPVGAGCPPILQGLGRVPSILLFDFFDFTPPCHDIYLCVARHMA